MITVTRWSRHSLSARSISFSCLEPCTFHCKNWIVEIAKCISCKDANYNLVCHTWCYDCMIMCFKQRFVLLLVSTVMWNFLSRNVSAHAKLKLIIMLNKLIMIACRVCANYIIQCINKCMYVCIWGEESHFPSSYSCTKL